MNQTVDTGGWRALEESHKAAHAEAKQIPLSILNEHRAAIEQEFREMASGARECKPAGVCQAQPLTSQQGNHDGTLGGN